MTDLDFESAQLQLLTEALRAGPGTPAWREALAALEASAGAAPEGADEFKLLYAARERLASGRQYREVRPGPGFTRKVFDSIEQEEPAGPRAVGVPSANLIAAVSAMVIIAVIALVAYFAIPRTSETGAGGAGGDLSQTYFTVTRSQSTFDTQLGADWSTFGSLPVEASNGLRPQLGSAATGPADFRGGGVAYQRDLPAGEPFAAEATVRAPKASDDLITQVFVTDDATFSGDRATSPHELVWLLRGGEASVALPDGTIASQGTRVPPGRPVEVRVAVARDQAAVEMNGKRLWSGPSGLAGDKPRVLGVRFLARGAAEQKDAPVVESVRVLAPQKP